MSSEGFEDRVRGLRAGWVDRRELQELGGEHDFASRKRLLAAIHGWMAAAVASIEAVYGAESGIVLSGAPAGDDIAAAVSVSLFGAYGLRFFLSERVRNGAVTWSVVGSLQVPNGRSESSTSVGPDRRGGAWTRGRIEEILLTMVSAYERDRLATARAARDGTSRWNYAGAEV